MASRKARGFALIEAVVAVSVLALTTAAAYAGWSVMVRHNLSTHGIGGAAQIARAEVETAKLFGADGLPLGVYSASSGTASWTGAFDPTANSGAGAWTSSVTTYYDAAGNPVASVSAAGATFVVQDTITDANVLATTGGGYALQPTSGREFVTTVTLVADGSTASRMGTLLVEGGL